MPISQQLSAFNYQLPGPLTWNPVQTANFTAVAGNSYPINTTENLVTVTLPQAPKTGDVVQFSDYAGTWQTNYVTLNLNGKKFNGVTSDIVAGLQRETIALVYLDETQGWIAFSGFNAITPGYVGSYLAIGGGGSGGINSSGGGGAGGLLTGNYVFQSGVTYTIVVGAGGNAITASGTIQPNGNPGSNTTISSTNAFTGTITITAYGGGFGAGTSAGSGGSGGAGGGSAGKGVYPGSTYISAARQGYDGGVGTSDGATYGVGGGGGGAGAAGITPVNTGNGTAGGAGGAGLASSITGSSVTYAGGGGGSGDSRQTHPGGSGGAGGGGNGSNSTNGATNGAANTGGGGGAGPYSPSSVTSGAGGSGVVILSVPTSKYTGTVTGSPTVTTSGTNTIIKFTASGTYTA